MWLRAKGVVFEEHRRRRVLHSESMMQNKICCSQASPLCIYFNTGTRSAEVRLSHMVDEEAGATTGKIRQQHRTLYLGKPVHECDKVAWRGIAATRLHLVQPEENVAIEELGQVDLRVLGSYPQLLHDVLLLCQRQCRWNFRQLAGKPARLREFLSQQRRNAVNNSWIAEDARPLKCRPDGVECALYRGQCSFSLSFLLQLALEGSIEHSWKNAVDFLLGFSLELLCGIYFGLQSVEICNYALLFGEGWISHFESFQLILI